MPRPPKHVSALRLIRESLSTTQVMFARRVGVSASYIKSIENGKRPLTREVAVRIIASYAVCHPYLEQIVEDAREEARARLKAALCEWRKLHPRAIMLTFAAKVSNGTVGAWFGDNAMEERMIEAGRFSRP